MKQKRCRICNELFTPMSSRQMDCNKIIMKYCAVCGKPYQSRCSKNATGCTCSDECRKTYTSRQRMMSYQKQTRQCALCGKPFNPTNNTQKYCTKFHEVSCAVCGKMFVVDTSKQEFAKTCSKECSIQLRFQNGNPFSDAEFRAKAKSTYEERTGYDHPMHNPQVVEKLRQTHLERYGGPYQATDAYKQKAMQTNLERYGTEWPIQNTDVQAKREQTNLERYGVANPATLEIFIKKARDTYQNRTGFDHPAHNPEVIERTKSTNLSKYDNEYAVASDQVRQKSRDTLLSRYGVDNPMKLQQFVDAAAETNLARYGHRSYLGSDENRTKLQSYMKDKHGVSHYSQSAEWKSDHMQDASKLKEWLLFLDDPEAYLQKLDKKPTLCQLSEALGVSDSTVSYWINYYKLSSYIHYTLSRMEDNVCDIIRNIQPDIQIDRHNRNKLEAKELDIYLPEYNIAIECNPTVTHNSSMCDPWGNPPKLPSYHLNKTLECESKNIFLFHIFGSEWHYKQPIIKSMIRNLLHKCRRSVYARNCEVKHISADDAMKFLINNHRQGGVHSKIRLGLYLGDELVSVMTFGKMRSTIGTDSTDLSDCYELVRFCSLLDTSVVGGASKLFKYFITNYQPTRIRSFSDRAHTKGNLYQTLGFDRIRESDPGYVWVDSRTDISYHRYSAQKQNIQKFLHDDTIDLSKTEKQIMEEHGFLQVFDSGTILWEWRAE